MLLTELWDDILKQREQNASTSGTQPTNTPKKPLTAKERQEQRKAEMEAKRQKQKDAMAKRSQHHGKKADDEESEDV